MTRSNLKSIVKSQDTLRFNILGLFYTHPSCRQPIKFCPFFCSSKHAQCNMILISLLEVKIVFFMKSLCSCILSRSTRLSSFCPFAGLLFAPAAKSSNVSNHVRKSTRTRKPFCLPLSSRNGQIKLCLVVTSVTARKSESKTKTARVKDREGQKKRGTRR